MELFDENLLSSLQPTSKDAKALVPTLISLFKTFQENVLREITSSKEELKAQIALKDEKISHLENEVTNLKKTVGKLQDKIEDNDAYERRDTIMVSGNALPNYSDGENAAEIVCRVVRSKLSYNLTPGDISVAHRFGGKSSSQRPDHRSIIVKLCRRSLKVDLLTSSRTKKCGDLFINEFLTPMRQTIAFVLRKAKKECPEVVSGSSTIDGRNFIWTKPPGAAPRGTKDIKWCINSHARLVEFCDQVLKKPLTNFISTWKH